MRRESPVKTATTFADFLEFENHSQERHEFVDGNLFVKAGGTDRHDLMAVLLTAMLFKQAFPKGCYAQSNDVLIRTPSGKGITLMFLFIAINHLTNLESNTVQQLLLKCFQTVPKP
jgi:Uma2 family endonuclease